MNKEKNVQPAETKKEQTTVLEKIRKRTGLLVGIVGLALVIFILESLLSSGRSIFGSADDGTSIGRINGKKIDRNEFLIRYENKLNELRAQRQTQELDEQTRSQVLDYMWNQYVNDLVIKPEFDHLGLFVSEDEVYERVVVSPGGSITRNLIDPKTGKLYDQLADAMGNLDPVKWRGFIQNATPDQENFIKGLEEETRNTRRLEKYSMLIRKGLYTTTAEAKEGYKTFNNKVTFSFVMKRFDSVSDSTVKVTDDDIQKYYSDNSYEFKNPETTRKVEYVAFNVLPSTEDIAAIEKDAKSAADKLKESKTLSSDSAVISLESENGAVSITDMNRKNMIVRDSTIYTAAPGTVFGPYNEGAYFKIYKLEGVNTLADSAKVRHILIGTIDMATQQPTRAKADAKKRADSLLTLIKDKKVTFDTLVKTVSEDMGSRAKGGDYGWFGEDKGFVEPFKMAGLKGTKGDITVVETVFGYHIIEVLDVSKTSHQSYKIAQIFKLIAPSDETNRSISSKASEFAGKNSTPEAFDKAVNEQKLTKRIADNIREGDRQLPGLDQAKDLVRWAYTAKKGDVNVFSMADKFIVAKLTAIKNKGILPLEDVKDEVTLKAKMAKKAELFLADFKSKAGSAANIEDVAGKMGLEVKKVEKMPFSSHSVEGTHDDVLMGTVMGVKAGQMSKATAGDAGVFVVAVSNIEQAPATQDYRPEQRRLEDEISSRSDYEVLNVLKEKAQIEDHKSRIE